MQTRAPRLSTGQLLQGRRERNGWSIAEVAKHAIDLTQEQIMAIEKGERRSVFSSTRYLEALQRMERGDDNRIQDIPF